ncbi:MAG: hypothetical protein IJB85_04780 [Clostridia bacterium]|nr:hypothetical protein [Clostridia bacterium]
MSKKSINVIGEKFNRLTVTGLAHKEKGFEWYYCDCDCGTKDYLVRKDNLLSGNTQSCSCLRKERRARNRIFALHDHEAIIVFYNIKNNYFVADLEDLPLIEKCSWHPNNRGEPLTTINGTDVSFARLKLGIVDSDLETDHVNHNPRDNRSCNIRSCTKLQNACNNVKGLGKIVKKAGAYILTIPDENGVEHQFTFDTKGEAEAFKHNWLDEHFNAFTFWHSQELAKKNRLHYFDPIEEINLYVLPENGKYDSLFNEIKALPERSIFKVELRRIHDLKMNIQLGRSSCSEERMLDRFIRLLEEYQACKTESTD